MPDSPTAKRSRASALSRGYGGTLNPAPRKVNAVRKFREESFFDHARHRIQVKLYEMLRKVSVDKMSLTQVSDEYGVTRPTFYLKAEADFEGAGIAGLVPRKRGPQGYCRSRAGSWPFSRLR